MITVLLLLIHLALLGATGASAQSVSCEARVGDPAGQLDAPEVRLLTDLTRDLADGGAQARVHLLDNTDAGIDRWFADAEGTCPDWRAGGDRAPDLLVLAVSLGDRETGTWYGEDLAPALEGAYLTVHERMARRPRRGTGRGAGRLRRPPRPKVGAGGGCSGSSASAAPRRQASSGCAAPGSAAR